MSVQQRVVIGSAVFCGVAIGAWWIITAKPPETKSTKHVSAAAVQQVKEEDLGLVKLTTEAEGRLGVETGTVERRVMKRVRMYGGEVMVPAGKTILVAAPLGGTVVEPSTGVPQSGAVLTKGQHVFSLQPIMSAEASTTFAASQADAEGQVKNAATQVEVMKLALERAQRIFRDGAGAKRAVEEAQAQYDLAQRTLEATQSRLDILTKATGDAAMGKAAPIIIDAPENGLLRNVSALPGQNVPAGGALFEMIDLTQVWVRVPVYVGDLNDLNPSVDVEIGSLNARPGEKMASAKPVQAPPTANALSSTVDLYYVLDNKKLNLTPGQRVGVTVPMLDEADSLVLPWGAVVHDLQGGTWVYEEKSKGVYKRARVAVRYVVDQTAVLAAGPAVGTKVVAAGAEELFGAETGFSK